MSPRDHGADRENEGNRSVASARAIEAMQGALNKADYINMNFRERSMWCQGARCGHIDGKARVGQYVAGEELAIDIAPQPHWKNRFERTCWEGGYCDGYRLGASGEALPAVVADWWVPGAP